MTIAADRATAGAAYLAAATAYVDAWVTLNGYDLATGFTGSFAIPDVIMHGEFLRDRPAVLRDPVSRSQALNATLRAPEPAPGE
jgi:hypothetical protein